MFASYPLTGMAPTSCERQVDLNMYLHDVSKMLIYDGTTGHINPHYMKHGSVVVENKDRKSILISVQKLHIFCLVSSSLCDYTMTYETAVHEDSPNFTY